MKRPSGRRPTIGCDLGGTNARAAIIDGEGSVLSLSRQVLEDRTPSEVARVLGRACHEALALAGMALGDMAGVGVGLAAQVRGHSGTVIVAPNLGWRDVRFGALMERELGRPARVVNDLAAAAWGEASVGAARGANDAMLVFVGSGVGSGLILSGRLHEGAGGIAGELGHTKVIPGGRPCGCGERGCLEAYTGGHNIKQRIRERYDAGKARAIVKAAGGDREKADASALEAAAELGDPEAVEMREEIARLLGLAVANAITLLNPQKLVLGGGVLTGMPGMKARMVEWVRDTGGRAHIELLSIVDTALGDEAGVIGAGLLATALTASS